MVYKLRKGKKKKVKVTNKGNSPLLRQKNVTPISRSQFPNKQLHQSRTINQYQPPAVVVGGGGGVKVGVVTVHLAQVVTVSVVKKVDVVVMTSVDVLPPLV